MPMHQPTVVRGPHVVSELIGFAQTVVGCVTPNLDFIVRPGSSPNGVVVGMPSRVSQKRRDDQ